MKKYIVEHEFDGYEIGTYLKEKRAILVEVLEI